MQYHCHYLHKTGGNDRGIITISADSLALAKNKVSKEIDLSEYEVAIWTETDYKVIAFRVHGRDATWQAR